MSSLRRLSPSIGYSKGSTLLFEGYETMHHQGTPSGFPWGKRGSTTVWFSKNSDFSLQRINNLKKEFGLVDDDPSFPKCGHSECGADPHSAASAKDSQQLWGLKRKNEVGDFLARLNSGDSAMQTPRCEAEVTPMQKSGGNTSPEFYLFPWMVQRRFTDQSWMVSSYMDHPQHVDENSYLDCSDEPGVEQLTVKRSAPIDIPSRNPTPGEIELESYAFSMTDGVGRTLKGRDQLRVRNQVLRMTGVLVDETE